MPAALAAYLRGFQNTYGVSFYAISIQNELDFDEFYNSCFYPLTNGYVAALKAVRAELNQYPDLAGIKIMGPEDVLGGNAYGMWQYGSGSTTADKNLQFLQAVGADPMASVGRGLFLHPRLRQRRRFGRRRHADSMALVGERLDGQSGCGHSRPTLEDSRPTEKNPG